MLNKMLKVILFKKYIRKYRVFDNDADKVKPYYLDQRPSKILFDRGFLPPPSYKLVALGHFF